MSLRETLYAALLDYIQHEVDQLAESIRELYEDSRVSGDEEDGYLAHIVLNIEYQVPQEIERRCTRNWRFHGSLDDLIYVIDNWKTRQV